MTRSLAMILLGAALAGCALGPDYRRPDVPVPEGWRDAGAEEDGAARPDAAAADPSSLADLSWWELFQDQELQGLIRTALEANKDLRIAAARVEEARALVGLTRADELPRLDAGASATTNRTSDRVRPRGMGVEQGLLAATIDLNFEVDLWGRLRRATEAARAELLATEEARRTVAITLVSDVAAAYVRLRELDLELEITRRSVETRRQSVQIARDRFEAGLTSALDLRQAEAELASTAAQVPDLERQVAQTEHLLSVLLGRNPGRITRGRPLAGQTFPPEVPAGLPSALLERRPDIRQAEATLVAANARIGVAKAAFFPQISLTGFFGVESAALSDLFTGPSRIWRAGPALTLPIFDAGRNRANLAATEARQRAALHRYEQAIQQAFREVEDALVAHRKAREALVEQEAAVRAARAALDVADYRYTSGLTSYLSVLDAQRTLLAAELAQSRTLGAQLLAVVQLYKALGGGWAAAAPQAALQ